MANQIERFSDDDRTRFLNAEFWGDRELLALCFGVPRYADRDDIASEADREAAKARIKAAIDIGDLRADRDPQAGASTLLYGPGAWNIKPADAIPWASLRFEKFPDWLVAAYQAMKDVRTHADIPNDVVSQHLEHASHDLPPEVADHLGRRLKLIGHSLSGWDSWSCGQRRNAVVMADEAAAIQRADAAMQARKLAEGRYTIREAAEILEARAGERVATMKRKLEQAVAAGGLPAYEPGRYARYEIGPGLDARRARSYYEEVYWNDLNAWLERNERRIAYRFPAPVVATNLNIAAYATADIEPCPDKFTLYWLNRKIDDDAVFAEQALAVLRQMNEQKPKVLYDTTTKASAASALVNEWLVNRDLPCYIRGRPVDDVTALEVESGEYSLSEALEILESDINVHRNDVVRLIKQAGMTVPPYLQSEAFDAPAATQLTAGDEHGGAEVTNSALPPIRSMTRKGDRWTDEAQRTLLAESKLPGMTHQKLADKYGVKRQRIGVLLKQAEDKFGTRRQASPFPTSTVFPRKIKRVQSGNG